LIPSSRFYTATITPRANPSFQEAYTILAWSFL